VVADFSSASNAVFGYYETTGTNVVSPIHYTFLLKASSIVKYSIAVTLSDGNSYSLNKDL